MWRFGRLILSVVAALAVAEGASALRAAAQAPSCDRIVSLRDIERCLGTAPQRPVPALDPEHLYTLPELINFAESNAPETRIAWTQAKAALEQAGVAQASYLPVLALVGEGLDSRVIAPFPKPIAPRGYVTVEQPIAVAQFELDYFLLDFGRGPRVEAARAIELAAGLRLNRAHQEVAFRASMLFYEEQRQAGRLAAAQTILQTVQTLLQSTQSQFDNGRATLPDLQNAQARAAQARFALLAQEGAVSKAKLSLTEAIGAEPTTRITLPTQPESIAPDTLAPRVETLIDMAWKSRPDLLARAQELQRARENIRSVHSAYLPSARLTASGGQTATWPAADYGTLGSANVTTWAATISFRWEVFNAARRHEQASAVAEAQGAAEEQRLAKDRVTREVWQAYVDYQTAIEQQRAAQSFLQAAQTSYDSSLDAFRYGVRSLVDVVEAERQLAEARQASVDANAQLTLSAATLTFTIGAQP